ncbi:MAG: hypothetical protein SFW67_20115 [Myxococcaceae bacterium]|nr:hypothetical protein [Myxococcaceae bacterium]
MAVSLVFASVATAGPMRAVEHGASNVSLFRDFALGPTLGASALWEPRGFGARLSLGLGLATFHPESSHDGALRWSVMLEGEVQVAPGPLEGSVLAAVNALGWRWFSLGAFAGVGVQGAGAWTIRAGPELSATLHRAWGDFDGVLQVFVRGSFALLRTDVFSSQVLLGLRVLIDVA